MALILVIDDEKDILENIGEVLLREGYDVLQAESGKIGLEKAKKLKPDLILCDINMKEFDGYQVLEEIRNKSATLHIPFIYLTVRDKPGDIDRGIEIGCQDYITKPYDNKVLLSKVKLRLKENEEKEKIKKQSDANYQELNDTGQVLAKLKLEIDVLESDKKKESQEKKFLLKKLEYCEKELQKERERKESEIKSKECGKQER